MPRGYQYSEEELLSDLRSLRDKLGRPPKTTDLTFREDVATSATYNNRFGSWSEALEAAGIEPEDTQSRAADHIPLEERKQELVEELRRVAEDLGHTPTTAEVDEFAGFSVGAYRGAFGDWESALQAIGLEPRDRANIPEEVLVDDLRTFAEYGPGNTTTPRASEMDAVGPHTSSTYENRFGSWGAALAQAGLDPRLTVKTDDLLFELFDLVEDGRPPSIEDVRRNGEYSLAAYRLQWGPWPAPIEAAAFDPPDDGEPIERYSASTLLEELRSASNSVEGLLSEDQAQSLIDIPTSVYVDRFGSWDRAQVYAGVAEPSEAGVDESGKRPIVSDGGVAVREAEVQQDGEIRTLAVGDALVDEWSDLVYRVRGIQVQVGGTVVEPEWIVVTDLVETDQEYQRAFSPEELEDRLGDSLVRFSGAD